VSFLGVGVGVAAAAAAAFGVCEFSYPKLRNQRSRCSRVGRRASCDAFERAQKSEEKKKCSLSLSLVSLFGETFKKSLNS
jgi:hypothetical protein